MIKNKKAIYFLLPVVLIVWGLIFYKVFNAVHSSSDEINYVSNHVSFVNRDSSLADTFTISGNYKDPFLKNIHSDRPENKPISSKESDNAKSKSIPKWPVIKYTGIVKNEVNGRQFVMIRINGLNKLMKVGDESSGVELTKVYRDSVEMKFLKEKKVFVK